MKNRKGLKTYRLLHVLFVLTFLIVFVGTSFAFFTARVSGVFSKVTLKSAKLSNVTASATSVTLEVLSKDMREINGRNDYSAYVESEEPSTITFSVVTGENDSGIKCTYNLSYTPTIPYIKSAANVNNYKEFTMFAYQSVNGSDERVQISGTVSEVDLTNVTSKKTILSGAEIIVNDSDMNVEVVWHFTPRYYNLGINQDDNQRKTFSGIITVDALICQQTQ